MSNMTKDVVAGEMPAELLTGNLSIDNEHCQVFSALNAARSLCSHLGVHSTCVRCNSERRTLCENELAQQLGDLLSYILEHFKHEEGIMHNSLMMMVAPDICEAHMEDHAIISAKMQRIAASLGSQYTISLLRELDTLLSNWIVHHIVTHDMPLVFWAEREDSVLGLSV